MTFTTAQLADPVLNPSHLDNRHLTYFGPGTRLNPQAAWDHFHGTRNPFLPDSAEYAEYVQLCATITEKERVKWLKLPEYPAIIRPSKRRLSMPRFKMQFDTEHDARLRLCSSFIFIGKDLCFCRDVRKLDNDYLLIVEVAEGGKTYRVWYSHDAVDLRSPEPQYIVYQDRPAFFGRQPNKTQRQGINTENAYIRFVGHQEFSRVHDFSWMMKKMDVDNTLWTPTLSDLMVKAEAFSALRLSKNIAFYRDGNSVFSEYRGRRLGEVNDDTIKVDEVDRKPWIDRDVKQVGCTLRV